MDYDFNSLRMEMMIQEIVLRYHQCRHPGELTHDTLHKLCYMVDSTFYQRYEISMTGESYVHTQKGPVPIHFDDSLDELITDDRVSVNDKGVITPCDAHDSMRCANREHPETPDVTNNCKFRHLIRHILPRPTSYEREVIAEIVSKYARMDLRRLETAVKQDPAWKLSSEGQLMDYEYVFYREDEQEVSNDDGE